MSLEMMILQSVQRMNSSSSGGAGSSNRCSYAASVSSCVRSVPIIRRQIVHLNEPSGTGSSGGVN